MIIGRKSVKKISFCQIDRDTKKCPCEESYGDNNVVRTKEKWIYEREKRIYSHPQRKICPAVFGRLECENIPNNSTDRSIEEHHRTLRGSFVKEIHTDCDGFLRENRRNS